MEAKQGWHPDPFDIHEMRWFSQGAPTQLVRDHGQESYDPPPGAPLPTEVVAPAMTPETAVGHPDAAETPRNLPQPALSRRAMALSPDELVWLEERALASLEAAKVAAAEATRLLSANPELDGSALAGSIWWFLNTQAELLAALRELTSDQRDTPASSFPDETLGIDLPKGWDEPREWLERTRRWRGKRR